MKLSLKDVEKTVKELAPKTLISAPNNKFIKAINTQVCEKIKNFSNNALLEFNEKDNTSIDKTKEKLLDESDSDG